MRINLSDGEQVEHKLAIGINLGTFFSCDALRSAQHNSHYYKPVGAPPQRPWGFRPSCVDISGYALAGGEVDRGKGR